MKKRSPAVIGTTICFSLLAGITVFAANITDQQAKDAVSAYIPSGSTYSRTNLDDGNYEIKYYNESKSENYEFTVSQTSGTILSFESKLYNHHGGSSVKLSQSDAENTVTAEMKGAEITSTTLEYDDGTEYEVKFRTGSLYGEYVIHPETGSILERNIKIRETSSNTVTDIGMDKAKQTALDKVPGATVRKIERDFDDGRLIYEGELYKDGWEYDFEIDGTTGTILKWEQDND